MGGDDGPGDGRDDGDGRWRLVEMSPPGEQRRALCATSAGLTRQGLGGIASRRPACAQWRVPWARGGLALDGSPSRAAVGGFALWAGVQASGKKRRRRNLPEACRALLAGRR